VEEQFGFRSKSSTKIASYNLISEILNALNNKNIIGGVFCDLVKAFDCVNHKILLSKLKFCGITGTFYSLIKSYLGDRYQRIKLENNQHTLCSSWGIIRHGVPQGSILGPLLFLLYINDITKVTHAKDDNSKSKLVLFAGDTNLLITSSNPTNFVQDINVKFTDINNWFKVNLLTLNFEKTNFMQFVTKNSSHIPFSVDGDINIKSNITHIKFLGIIIDNTLTWRSHIEVITPKLSVACFVLKAIKPSVLEDTLKLFTFVFPFGY
jgi:hypothetical protein